MPASTSPFQASLRASLMRSLDQRANDDAIARSTSASLRISVFEKDATQWTGAGVIALKQPAPEGSADARWAAAVLPGLRLLVDAPAGVGFGYPQVRAYAGSVVAALVVHHPKASCAALALPGPDHGLDESACMEYLLLGLVDALAVSSAATLQEIVLIEPLSSRRKLLVAKLHQLFPNAFTAPHWVLDYFPASGTAPRVPAPFEQQLTIQDTLTAFIAMPFAKGAMTDVFRYGIQAPAQRCRFRAERLDFEHYTGSIVDEIKDRIQRAHLVIADVTGANPNVFLEIGYAWGKGRPTLLLRGIGDMAPPESAVMPPFDVAGDNRIDYDSIASLDEQLSEKLTGMYPELRRRAAGGG